MMCAPEVRQEAKKFCRAFSAGIIVRCIPDVTRLATFFLRLRRGTAFRLSLRASMPEMPDAREDHREAVLACGGDHLRLAPGAAGLYDGGDAVPGGFVNAVAEREEGVGREHGVFDGKLRAHRADAHRVNARHLTRADAYGLARARVDDCVRLRVLADRPREQKRRDLFVRRRAPRDDLQVFAREAMRVARLYEHAAGDAFEVQAFGPSRVARAQYAQVLLRLQNLDRRLVEVRRDDDLRENLRDGASRTRVNTAVKGDYAAEGRDRVGCERAAVRLFERLGGGRARRIHVLDDRARRLVEVADELPRGVRVNVVVERHLLAAE